MTRPVLLYVATTISLVIMLGGALILRIYTSIPLAIYAGILSGTINGVLSLTDSNAIIKQIGSQYLYHFDFRFRVALGIIGIGGLLLTLSRSPFTYVEALATYTYVLFILNAAFIIVGTMITLRK